MKIVAGVLLLSVACSASAQDLADDWTGAYFGAHAGYSEGEIDMASSTSVLAETGVFDHDASGPSAGIQAGADWQLSGPWVVGFVADLDAGRIGEKISLEYGLDGAPYVEGPRIDVDIQTDINYFGTLRGRVGYAVGQNLFFGTAGLSYVNHTGSSYVNLAGPEAYGQTTETHVGWVAGLGVERRFTDQLSIAASWLHSDSGDDRYVIDHSGAAVHGGGIEHIDIIYRSDSFRVDMNYRF